jgi:acetoin utilization deacetylase AcuC-like enzyme
MVLQRVRDTALGDVIAPTRFGRDVLHRVHDAEYVEFLASAWRDWTAGGYGGEAIADCWPGRRMSQRRPDAIKGRMAYYAASVETSIGEGTWEAAQAAADVALSAAALVAGGAPSAFALCRPPGHHASADQYGGYCFLNNAALAAQALRDAGASRVAVLDVDYHHGNGTQDIFYQRGDVFVASIHGDPRVEFPYFLGHADETGAGAGADCTLNLPLPKGTGFETWHDALGVALDRIRTFGAEALVVSLGVDTYAGDPVGAFRLAPDDFATYGRTIGATGLPTTFVLEGGYAVAELGINVVNVLAGFEEHMRTSRM